jgi:hypothetical protein
MFWFWDDAEHNMLPQVADPISGQNRKKIPGMKANMKMKEVKNHGNW